MITGLGTDIVEIKRITRANNEDRLARRILSENELKVYNGINNETRKNEYVAGRFSAKEAYSKALGTGIGAHIQFHEISIMNDELSKPFIEASSALISISHSREYATATVILIDSN